MNEDDHLESAYESAQGADVDFPDDMDVDLDDEYFDDEPCDWLEHEGGY